jgi:hypothetical protein
VKFDSAYQRLNTNFHGLPLYIQEGGKANPSGAVTTNISAPIDAVSSGAIIDRRQC